MMEQNEVKDNDYREEYRTYILILNAQQNLTRDSFRDFVLNVLRNYGSEKYAQGKADGYNEGRTNGLSKGLRMISLKDLKEIEDRVRQQTAKEVLDCIEQNMRLNDNGDPLSGDYKETLNFVKKMYLKGAGGK